MMILKDYIVCIINVDIKKKQLGLNIQSLSECENYVKSYQLDRLRVEVVAQQSCSFDSNSLDLAISAKANLGYGLKLACSLP